jgi:hypothetical protein
MSMFLPVVAVPVTFPVTLPVTAPVKGPENARAVIVPEDGFTFTLDTVEVAAPDTDVVAGVNMIGWLALVEASVTSTFLPVVAVPVRLPVKAPLNVVAVIVPEDGVTNTVVTLEVAAPDTEVA